MKKISVILIILFVLMIFLSCKDTPEEMVVLPKNIFDEKLFTTGIPQNDNLQNSISKIDWCKSANTKHEFLGTTQLTVTVNCEIQSPPITEILTVIPAEFDMDDVNNAIEFFLDEPYFDYTLSVDDWQTKIIYLKEAMLDENSDDEYLKDTILYFESIAANAPDINLPAKTDFFTDERGGYLSYKNYPDQKGIGNLSLINHGKSCTVFDYHIDFYNKIHIETDYIYEGEPARGLSISFEEAQGIADDVIDAICGSSIMDFKYATYVSVIDMEDFSPDEMSNMKHSKEANQCYEFHYTRKYNLTSGARIVLASSYLQSVDFNYAEIWHGEEVKVRVDDNGLNYFSWHSPTAVIDTINHNVALLEFETVFEIFKNNIFYNNIWAEDRNQKIEILIDSIEYGIVRLPIEDNIDTYVTVPVWCFNGNKYVYSNDEIEDKLLDGKVSKTFIIINAVDETIIDANLGY